MNEISQCRYFADPKPSIRDILDSTSAFCNAINRSLKMGVNKECRLTVNFHSDVFRFLFKDRGSEYPHGKGRLYVLEDFNTTYFPTDWYRVNDRLGDGCKIDFPMRLLSKVKWSPTVYATHGESAAVHPKKKYFDEVCIAWVAKQRC